MDHINIFFEKALTWRHTCKQYDLLVIKIFNNILILTAVTVTT